MANILADVYFFKGKEAAKKLHAGTISNHVVMKNFVAYSLVAEVSINVPLTFYADQSAAGSFFLLIDIFYFFAVSVATYFGLWSCFKENRRGDDRQFFLRFLCLSLPWLYA